MITNKQILVVIERELCKYIDLDGVDIQANYDNDFKIKYKDVTIWESDDFPIKHLYEIITVEPNHTIEHFTKLVKATITTEMVQHKIDKN